MNAAARHHRREAAKARKIMASRHKLATLPAAAAAAAFGVLLVTGIAPSPASLGEIVVSTAHAATNEELLVAGPLGEKALGDPEAPNVVVEYASMTCPHCRSFHENTFEAFKEKYIDTGEVYFVFRHFPLNPVDAAAVMLTNCVPDERFFPLVDLLYDQQQNWAFVESPAEALLDLVKQAGFTQETFLECLKNQEVLDGIDWVRTRGSEEFEVESTPTFFINGEKMSGALTLDQIDEILAE
jgi:protein-disulfide isomerase